MPELKRKDLENFINDKSGEYPPVFVGRDDVIKDILTTSRRAFERGSAPAKNTIIIQGAPGAGKTSVLTELSQRSTHTDNQPRPIIATSADIKNRLPEVMKAIAVVASKPKIEWLNIIKNAGVGLARRAGSLSFLSFSADFANMVKETEPKDLFALRNMLPPDKWVNPVILAIDEAQRFAGDHTSPHAEFLQYVHDAIQAPMPLTLVFAGLGDTEARVNEMGITNGILPYTIGALTPKEREQVVDGFCTHFGITVGCLHERLHSFFDSTDGWPRHIYWAQRALAETLLKPEINGRLAKIYDWNSVENQRDQFRIGYYENRNSPDMKRSAKLVGALMTTVAVFMEKDVKLKFAQIGNLIDYFVEKFAVSDRGWRVPERFGSGVGVVDRFIEHLVHQGALAEEISLKSYVCPIPSFQAYLIEQADFTPKEKRALEQTLVAEVPDKSDGHNP